MKKYQSNRMLIIVILLFILTLSLFTTVVFAWISQSRNASIAPFVASVKDLAIDFDFYKYDDNNQQSGSSNYTLTNNVCSSTINCYDYLENPTTDTVIPSKLEPNDRLSYAIVISNRSNSLTTLDVFLNGVTSTNYILSSNQIQRAFKYEVKAIKYLNNEIESTDIKDSINYANTHFVPNVSNYTLIGGLPLNSQNQADSVVIIFFDLYFDPNVGSYDADGNLLNHSNAFMNQVFKVEQLLIDYED